ncbi:CDGSH iron-sulfur domain-containing protein [Oerskovia sp. USHLN155]|uniref:CDGSH iron-sulfur domain-containing protein n=1 Tax=Oerskovia sp. USHLN155 TaxID=3081288 RepID=UPI00301971D3
MNPDATADGAHLAEGEDLSITLCPDGPLLVRGRPTILDGDGNQVDARRGTVALCRCGASAIKPFCDGTHKVNGFRSGD